MFTSSFSVTQKKAFMFISLLLNVCNAKWCGIGSSTPKYTIKALDCFDEETVQDNILKNLEVVGYAGISNLKDNLEMVLKCRHTKLPESRKYLVNLAFQRRSTGLGLNGFMKCLKLKSAGEFHVTIIDYCKKFKDYKSENLDRFTSPRTGDAIVPDKEFYGRLSTVLEANKPRASRDRASNKIRVFDIVKEFRGHKYSHTAGSALKGENYNVQSRLDNRRTMMRKVALYLQGEYNRKTNGFWKKLGNFALDAAYGTVSMLPLVPQIGVIRATHEAHLGRKIEDWIIGQDKDLEEYLRAVKKAEDTIKKAHADIKKAQDKLKERKQAKLNTQRRLITLEKLL